MGISHQSSFVQVPLFNPFCSGIGFPVISRYKPVLVQEVPPWMGIPGASRFDRIAEGDLEYQHRDKGRNATPLLPCRDVLSRHSQETLIKAGDMSRPLMQDQHNGIPAL
jgi:hypothetical protein